MNKYSFIINSFDCVSSQKRELRFSACNQNREAVELEAKGATESAQLRSIELGRVTRAARAPKCCGTNRCRSAFEPEVLQKGVAQGVSIQRRQRTSEFFDFLAVGGLFLLRLLSQLGQLLLVRLAMDERLGLCQPQFLFAGGDEVELLFDLGVIGSGWHTEDVIAELVELSKELVKVQRALLGPEPPLGLRLDAGRSGTSG